jgi:hypothetical protein
LLKDSQSPPLDATRIMHAMTSSQQTKIENLNTADHGFLVRAKLRHKVSATMRREKMR